MAGTPHPGPYSKAEWAEYRRQGSAAVRLHSGLQFALGDLVVDVLAGAPRGHGEVGQAIEALAYAIDIPASTLRKYYEVAKQWPAAKRRPDVCWSVHERLAYVPVRYTLIRTDPYDPVSDDHHWTVNEATKISRGAPSTLTSQQERLALAQRLLHRDEDTAEAAQVRRHVRPPEPPTSAQDR